jgi:hypothetical protein
MIGLDRVTKLLIGIVITLILLTICITVDSADDNIINETANETIIINGTNVTINATNAKPIIVLKSPEPQKEGNYTKINGTYVKTGNGQAKTDGKIYSEVPLITITSKPSCGCNHGYYWHKRTFENYCPNCHRYGTLHNAHKWGSRYERELTCSHCDSDFCGVCGKEKYGWSRVRLTPKVNGIEYVGKWSVIG